MKKEIEVIVMEFHYKRRINGYLTDFVKYVLVPEYRKDFYTTFGYVPSKEQEAYDIDSMPLEKIYTEEI